MNHYLAVLSALVILPFALQAKPLSGSQVASGVVRFTGAITTPTCAITHQDEQLISNCFGKVTEYQNGYISSSLKEMPKELVSAVTSEMVNNDPHLKRVTISYK
ncbi:MULTISPECIES: hypothetical protein [Serratia]|uniref:hypothetical protein n=1 Tax=Serratia TaxID=613 RepID=UPI000C197FFD|nr:MULTISPECIES: hypothetical protein [unclassified Serratia (in: enterobacteria)]PIJ09097.1 hypothetical protein BVV00_14795 [Serratia sp. OMLW3]PIJ15452.1 hypothetical protein BVU99_15140 [Serratia sp. OLAL2]HEJ0102953.1 hypothetical protein [Serratia marcescens]